MYLDWTPFRVIIKFGLSRNSRKSRICIVDTVCVIMCIKMTPNRKTASFKQNCKMFNRIISQEGISVECQPPNRRHSVLYSEQVGTCPGGVGRGGGQGKGNVQGGQCTVMSKLIRGPVQGRSGLVSCTEGKGIGPCTRGLGMRPCTGNPLCE